MRMVHGVILNITSNGECQVKIPEDAKVLKMSTDDDGILTMWLDVDDNSTFIVVSIYRVYEHERVGANDIYLGSYLQKGYTEAHLFYKVPD